MALVIVIVAEMFIGSDNGLGHRIIDAQQVMNVKSMYAAILAAGVLDRCRADGSIRRQVELAACDRLRVDGDFVDRVAEVDRSASLCSVGLRTRGYCQTDA